MPKFLDNIEFYTEGYNAESLIINQETKSISLNEEWNKETVNLIIPYHEKDYPAENPAKKKITDISRDIRKEKDEAIYKIEELSKSGLNATNKLVQKGLNALNDKTQEGLTKINAAGTNWSETLGIGAFVNFRDSHNNIENGTGTDSIVQKYSGQIDETHFGNISEGESGAVFGEANSNSGNRAIVSGKMNRNSAPNSLIIGLGNGRGIGVNPTIDALSGEQLFVFGTDNSVSNGDGNAVLGNENTLSDVRYTTIIGRGNIINNTSLYEGKCVVGRYNNQKRDTMFEVGVGDYNNRVNGLEVYKDGRVKVHGEPKDDNDVTRRVDLIAKPITETETIIVDTTTVSFALDTEHDTGMYVSAENAISLGSTQGWDSGRAKYKVIWDGVEYIVYGQCSNVTKMTDLRPTGYYGWQLLGNGSNAKLMMYNKDTLDIPFAITQDRWKNAGEWLVYATTSTAATHTIKVIKVEGTYDKITPEYQYGYLSLVSQNKQNAFIYGTNSIPDRFDGFVAAPGNTVVIDDASKGVSNCIIAADGSYVNVSSANGRLNSPAITGSYNSLYISGLLQSPSLAGYSNQIKNNGANWLAPFVAGYKNNVTADKGSVHPDAIFGSSNEVTYSGNSQYGLNLITGNTHKVKNVALSLVAGLANRVECLTADNYIGANLVGGQQNVVNHSRVVMGGARNKSDRNNQFVAGIYSAPNEKALLKIGNGTSDADKDRKNAFEVLEDGRATIQTAPQYTNDVANKGYVDDGWNKFNLENGTGTGSLVQKTVSSSGTPYANEASGSGSVAMGKKVKSKGNATFVTGQENEAIAGTSASFTSGRLNVNRGSYNITGGENNANNNSWNLVIGKGNAVSDGRFGIVSGLDNVFTGLGSDENTAVSMLGKNLYVQYQLPSDGALLIGRYNRVQNNTGRLFIVGNGTSPDDRKNAFEVLENGRAKVYGKPVGNDDVLRWQEKVGLETKINKINTFINTIFTDTTRVHFTESGSFGTGLWFSEAGIYRVKATYTYGSESGTDILIFSVSMTYNTTSGGSYEIKTLKNGNRVIATSDRQGGGSSTADQMQWIYLYSGTGGGTQVTNWKYEELNLADLGTIS